MNTEKQYITRRKVGDRVHLTRADSIKHRAAIGAPTIGVIIAIDLDNRQGNHYRPFLVRFDDGYESWWHTSEIRNK